MNVFMIPAIRSAVIHRAHMSVPAIKAFTLPKITEHVSVCFPYILLKFHILICFCLCVFMRAGE